MDAQLHLAADLERRNQETVERVVDRAFGRVLDWHHAKIRIPRLDLMKYLFDRGERQSSHRVTEVRQHRRLCKGAFRSQETDLERLLLRSRARRSTCASRSGL